jgi:diguanylate cyclase (GGDEF)-like protein
MIGTDTENQDRLTGLPTRQAIASALDQTVSAATSEGGQVSVVVFDVDGMKAFQDEHGYPFGDELLKQLAGILSENFGGGHSVGRLSGDSFLAVLPDTRSETAFVLAEEVRRLFTDNDLVLTAEGRTIRRQITVKAGVASFPSDARKPEDLIRKAEEAMYRAAQQGGNRIFLPDDSQMVTKTNYYTQAQLERIAALAKQLGRTEAALLREALDDLLRKYDDLS